MAVDWTKPTIGSNYLDVLDELRERDIAVATAFQDETGTPPLKAIKWDASQNKWLVWSGPVDQWQPLADTYNINVSKISGKELSDLVQQNEKGQANGVATLNNSGFIPDNQLGTITFGTSPNDPYHLILKGLTGTQLSSYTGVAREIVINTSTNRPHLMTGGVAGGLGLALLSDFNAGSFNSLSVANNASVGGSFSVGSSGTQGFWTNGNGLVGFGTDSPENSENWNRALDIVGGVNGKLQLRTGNHTLITAVADGSIYGATAGGIIGTRTNSPLFLVTNGNKRVTLDTNGKLIAHNSLGVGNNGAEITYNALGQYVNFNKDLYVNDQPLGQTIQSQIIRARATCSFTFNWTAEYIVSNPNNTSNATFTVSNLQVLSQINVSSMSVVNQSVTYSSPSIYSVDITLGIELYLHLTNPVYNISDLIPLSDVSVSSVSPTILRVKLNILVYQLIATPSGTVNGEPSYDVTTNFIYQPNTDNAFVFKCLLI